MSVLTWRAYFKRDLFISAFVMHEPLSRELIGSGIVNTLLHYDGLQIHRSITSSGTTIKKIGIGTGSLCPAGEGNNLEMQ